jgi:hypothetical protein
MFQDQSGTRPNKALEPTADRPIFFAQEVRACRGRSSAVAQLGIVRPTHHFPPTPPNKHKMKTTRRLLLMLALLVLAGYSVFTTMRVHQLEARLSRVELAQRTSTPFTYAFDDSFRQHFGQQGVDAVDRAMRRGVTDPDQILRDTTRELKLQ